MHVSGHGSEEELKLVLSLVRPKYFVPIHGEFRQLARHARVAKFVTRGLPSPVEVHHRGERRRAAVRCRAAGASSSKTPVGRVLIDGTRVGEVDDEVLRDRRHISTDGLIVPVVAINARSGVIEGVPELVARGFVSDEGTADVLAEGARGRRQHDRRVQRRGARRSGLDEGAHSRRAAQVPEEAHGPAPDGAAGRDGNLDGGTRPEV